MLAAAKTHDAADERHQPARVRLAPAPRPTTDPHDPTSAAPAREREEREGADLLLLLGADKLVAALERHRQEAALLHEITHAHRLEFAPGVLTIGIGIDPRVVTAALSVAAGIVLGGLLILLRLL